MKKAELIKRVAEVSGQSQATVKEMMEAVRTVSLEGLNQGQEVSIADLVTLRVADVAERSGESFGKKWVTPEHKVIKAGVVKKYKKLG